MRNIMSSTLWEGTITEAMPSPEDATKDNGVSPILGARSVSWMVKPGHANVTGFKYRVHLKPEKARGESAKEPGWWTDSESSSKMQGIITFPSPNSTGGRIITIDRPPGEEAYLEIYEITGADLKLHVVATRGQ